ncbi:MAG: regulatory protein RecX [Limnochordia bacterium]|jgi:regulatory protein
MAGLVTAVHKKGRDVYEVCLDNDRVFLCPSDVLVRRQVAVGKRIGPSELEELLADAEKTLAVREALAMVARASRTQHEVIVRLERKGFGPVAVDTAVERLSELGYIDDPGLAKRLVREFDERGDMGHWRKRQKLLHRGFDADVVEAAVGPLTEDAERQRALALARKRPPPINETQMRRLAHYLYRRGFSESIVWWCLRQLGAEVDIDQW